jgi:hypothetical protein
MIKTQKTVIKIQIRILKSIMMFSNNVHIINKIRNNNTLIINHKKVHIVLVLNNINNL